MSVTAPMLASATAAAAVPTRLVRAMLAMGKRPSSPRHVRTDVGLTRRRCGLLLVPCTALVMMDFLNWLIRDPTGGAGRGGRHRAAAARPSPGP